MTPSAGGTLPEMRERPTREMLATCSRGLEEVLASELVALGAAGVTTERGVVHFSGDRRVLYAANLWLRTAMRVLVPVAGGPAPDRDALYSLASEVPWEDYLGPDTTFAVEAVGRTPAFANTAFAGLVVKDAVVDRLRRRLGRRPDVDRRRPDLGIHLHLGRSVTLSLDTTGEPLSHRGYRRRGGPAPLAESLAAGIILLAGYDGSQPLLDPMCGSGTIAVEAALLATRTAPGLGRRFACERWPGHDAGLLDELRDEAERARRAAPAPITARDLDPRAVARTRAAAAAAGVDGAVTVEHGDLGTLAAPPGGMVVSNPPYGHRLGEVDELRPLYRRLGDALKHGATGATAWLLMGERDLAKEIGLRPARRIVLFNGPIECRLVRYDIF